MFEFLKSLLSAQTGSLLIVFGMVLLLLAIIGAIQGKISLESKARVTAGALGLISLTVGVWLQIHNHASPASAQVQPNATIPQQSAPTSGETASNANSKPGAQSATNSARPSAPVEQGPVPPTLTVPEQPSSVQTPLSRSKQRNCRINPKPWRWTTTGQLLIDVDGQRVGAINVGKDQSGFDFVCTPGDHKYQVRSDTMSVACSGAIVFEADATTLDLVFSQTSPGPPDCSLASVR